uniref:Core domain-containing protein n=1 Tax=Bangia fuscopurpurea TaxID=101920 RepID=A0A0F6VXF5_BANFU|nr:hypothetical protein 114 [Bangia fuscopurpurea]
MERNMDFIKITEKALEKIISLKSAYKTDVYLRIGVRQGGCSGMSYSMNFEGTDTLKNTDEILKLENFLVACDPKSLLHLYGLSLDYSND